MMLFRQVIGLVLILALLGVEAFAPLAQAQTRTPRRGASSARAALSGQAQSRATHAADVDARQMAAEIWNLVQEVALLDENPDYDVGGLRVLKLSLEKIRELDARIPSLGDAALRADLQHLRNAYVLKHHNRVVAAAALAEQVARMTGDENLKGAAFSAVLDVVPEVNPNGALVPSIESASGRRTLDSEGRLEPQTFLLPAHVAWGQGEVTNDVVRQLVLEVAGMQTRLVRQRRSERTGRFSASDFQMRLAVENSKAFLRSYWLYKGRYENGSIPEGPAAVGEVAPSQWFNAAQTQELYAAVNGVRARLRLEGGTASSRMQQLVRRLNEARLRLKRFRAAAPQRPFERAEDDRSDNGGPWDAWLQIRKVHRFLTVQGAIPDAHEGPGGRGGQLPGEPNSPLEHFAALAGVGQYTGRFARVCRPDGKLTVSTWSHAPIRELLRPLYPGHEQQLLNDLLARVHNDTPRPAESAEHGDGCVTSAAPNGYNRVQFLMGFLEDVYLTRFSETRGSRSRVRDIQDLPPWELDGSAAYMRQLNFEINQEPLLATDTLKEAYIQTFDGRGRPQTSGYPIAETHVRQALREQQESIKSQMQQIVRLAARTDHREAISQLLSHNEPVAWRAAAYDWRYLHALSEAYAFLRQTRLSEVSAESNKTFAFAGSVLLVIMLVSTGVGFFVGGIAGTMIVMSGSVAGIILGAQWSYAQFFEFTQAFNDYVTMRALVVSGVGNHPERVRRAEDAYRRMWWEGAVLVGSGILLLWEVRIMMQTVRALGQVANVQKAFRNAMRRGTILDDAETWVQIGSRRMSALSRGQRQALAEATQDAAIEARRLTQTLDQHSREVLELVRRDGITAHWAEARVLAKRRFGEQIFSRFISEARTRGVAVTPHLGFVERIRYFMQSSKGVAFFRSRTPGWASQLARRMGFQSLAARVAPPLTNFQKVNDLFKPVFESAFLASRPRPMLDALSTSEHLAETLFTIRDARQFSQVKPVLEALARGALAPADLATHYQMGMTAVRLAADEGVQLASPAFQRALMNGASGLEGGFWGTIARNIRPGGQLDSQAVNRTALELRTLLMGFVGGILVGGTAQAAVYGNSQFQFLIGRDDFITVPESVLTLVPERAMSSLGVGRLVDPQVIQQVEHDALIYRVTLNQICIYNQAIDRCRRTSSSSWTQPRSSGNGCQLEDLPESLRTDIATFLNDREAQCRSSARDRDLSIDTLRAEVQRCQETVEGLRLNYPESPDPEAHLRRLRDTHDAGF